MKYDDIKDQLREGMKVKFSRSKCCPMMVGGTYELVETGGSWYVREVFHILDSNDELEIVTEEKAEKASIDEFKVGDRVKYTSGNYTDYNGNNPLWKDTHMAGTVTDVGLGIRTFVVRWDNGKENHYHSDDIEHLSDRDEWILGAEAAGWSVGYEGRWDAYNSLVSVSIRKFNEAQPQKESFIMNIIQKIKDLALTEDDQILRRHGLETSEGKMTVDAEEMMREEIIAERWAARRSEIAENLREIEAKEAK